MVSSDDSIIVGLKNSIVNKINTLIGNHNESNDAHEDIRESIPTKVSDLTNDSGFLTSHNPIDASLSSTSTNAVQNKAVYGVKSQLDGLGDAFSSNMTTIYNNLSTKIDTAGTGLTKEGTALTHSNSVTAQTSTVFKKISYDGQGHITGIANVTASDIPTLTKSKISDFGHTHNTSQVSDTSAYTNIGSSANANQKTINGKIDTILGEKANTDDLAAVATTGSYNDLDNKPTIPTKVSDLTNDSNFVSTDDSRLSDARTPTSHQHGNISNDGKVTTVKTIGENTNVSSDYFIIRDVSDSNATKSANVIDVLNKVVLDLIDEGES